MSNITVSITPRMYAKIFAYTTECATEISGFGSFNREGVIDNLFPLLDQTCTSVETEISQEALAQFASGGLSAKANVHWHSHVNMSVFWSTTDKENVESLMRVMPVLVSIVVNKKGEYKARLDYAMPTRLTFDEISLEILVPPLPDSDRKKIRDEIENKVSFFKSITGYSSNYVSPYIAGQAFGSEEWRKGREPAIGQSELFPAGSSNIIDIPQWILDLPDKKMRKEILRAIRKGRYIPEKTINSSSALRPESLPPIVQALTQEEMKAYLDSINDLSEENIQ